MTSAAEDKAAVAVAQARAAVRESAFLDFGARRYQDLDDADSPPHP